MYVVWVRVRVRAHPAVCAEGQDLCHGAEEAAPVPDSRQHPIVGIIDHHALLSSGWRLSHDLERKRISVAERPWLPADCYQVVHGMVERAVGAAGAHRGGSWPLGRRSNLARRGSGGSEAGGGGERSQCGERRRRLDSHVRLQPHIAPHLAPVFEVEGARSAALRISLSLAVVEVTEVQGAELLPPFLLQHQEVREMTPDPLDPFKVGWPSCWNPGARRSAQGCTHPSPGTAAHHAHGPHGVPVAGPQATSS